MENIKLTNRYVKKMKKTKVDVKKDKSINKIVLRK